MKGAERGLGGEDREAAAGGSWHRTGGAREATGPAPGGSHEPRDPGSAFALCLLGARLGTPTSCPLPRVSFDTSSELGFLQSAFEAARRARGLRSCTWTRARVARGGGTFRSRVSTAAGSGVDGGPVPLPGKAPLSPAGEPWGGGRTKPYCGLGTEATEWLLFLR